MFAWEDGSTEPVLPASIIVGGISVNVLLGSSDVPIGTEPAGRRAGCRVGSAARNVAGPGRDFMDGLVGCSDTHTRSDMPSATPTDAPARSGFPSAWAIFVTGMDQALEQTCRDIRDGIPRDAESLHAGRTTRSNGKGQSYRPSRRDRLGRASPTCPDGDVLNRTLRSQENSQPDSNEGPGVALDVMPMLSVVSISAVIAGWFWRQRQRLRRMGLGGRFPGGRDSGDCAGRAPVDRLIPRSLPPAFESRP